MLKRILTVSSITEREVANPFIRLRGAWLARAGFQPQDQIEVQATKPGTLVIIKRIGVTTHDMATSTKIRFSAAHASTEVSHRAAVAEE
jgi:hypothetical protein